MNQAPQLYLITDRHATRGRPLAVVVAAALHGAPPGDRAKIAVQLREKDLSGRQSLELALELRVVTRHFGAQLFVNDRVDVALASGADGVHLGAGSLCVQDVRQIAPSLRIGVSTHSRADIEMAAAGGASFAVFGPVFETPSKRALGRPQGLESLASAAQTADGLGLPLVALGGVVPQNGAACLAAGAVGLACIRAVLSDPDPGAIVACFCNVSSSRVGHFDT